MGRPKRAGLIRENCLGGELAVGEIRNEFEKSIRLVQGLFPSDTLLPSWRFSVGARGVVS
jgi:hypothetical protein